ncbi:MAG: site-specific integrase, partial [Alphaproteobacteria bacterium]
ARRAISGARRLSIPKRAAPAASAAAPAIRVAEAFDLLTDKLVAEGKTSMLRQVEGARTLAWELLMEPEANPRLDALTPEIVELWRRTLLTVPRIHGKTHGNNRHTANRRTPLTKRAEIEQADAKDAALRAELDAACAQRALTRPSAEARFAEERVARMAVVTVEKHLARLKQAIDLARKRGRFAGPNPCDEVEPLDRAQIERLEQERRHPGRVAWEPERLVAHLDGPVHTGCASEHRRGDRGDVVIRDSLYWVFLLAWLAGLRLREALQLRCADIVRVHGVWCVDVQAGPGQRLKNAHSRRRIPLHRFLLELGFIDWVQAKREAGPWLFDDCHGFAAADDMVRRFTRRFTNYRKRIGTYAVGRDAHALRTTFNTGLARAGVELVVRKRLMGHKLADLTEDDYLPGGRELRQLKAAVDAAGFGLDLTVRDGLSRFTVRDDHAFADASEAETCAGDLAIAPDGSPLFLELVAAADTPGVPAEIRAAWLEDGAPRRLEATIRPHRSWGRPPAARRDPPARDAVELARALADALHGRIVVGLARDSDDLLARLLTLQADRPRYRVLEPSVPLSPYAAAPEHASHFAEQVAKAAQAGRALGASELCGLWHQAGAYGSHPDRRPADEAARSP